MIKTTIVAFFVLTNSLAHSSNLSHEISKLESEWAKLYYLNNNQAQRTGYPILLDKTKNLLIKYPESTGIMIWHAIITSAKAAHENPFTALNSIDNAKKQLEHVIKTNPTALEGAAFVVLGTLYYMTPGWPISFGDEQKAEALLKTGLAINPSSIDSNYFYADYLLSIGQTEEAKKHFKLAIMAPIRLEQQFADQQLKNEALNALHISKQSKIDSTKNTFISIFTRASSN